MTSKQLIVSAAVLSLIITAGVIGYTKAAETPGDTAVEASVERAHYGAFAQRFGNRKDMDHAFGEVREAIENDDYEAWAELMKDRPHAADMITRDTFDKLKELHELKQDGDLEGAKKLAEELGMQRFGDRKVMNETMRAIRDAIENKDYEAWAALMNEQPHPEGVDVSEEAFNARVEMHELMQEGNFEGAKALADESGLKQPNGGPGMPGPGMHGGMHRMNGESQDDQ